MDLVESISPRQMLNSFIWIVCRNAQCVAWSDMAGMFSELLLITDVSFYLLGVITSMRKNTATSNVYNSMWWIAWWSTVLWCIYLHVECFRNLTQGGSRRAPDHWASCAILGLCPLTTWYSLPCFCPSRFRLSAHPCLLKCRHPAPCWVPSHRFLRPS